MNVRDAAGALRIAACFSAAALAGCGGNPFATARVDPASPIAAEVAKGARAERDYPSFNEIPPKPNDVRPLQAYGAAARGTVGARAEMERETAPGAWTLQVGGTDPFAARAQSAAGENGGPSSRGATEAFARDAQSRATPPPPPR